MKKLSVIGGGPLDRLQHRLGFMKLEAPLIVRRAFVFSVVAWLPLLILSALQGTLLTNVRIPDYIHRVPSVCGSFGKLVTEGGHRQNSPPHQYGLIFSRTSCC